MKEVKVRKLKVHKFSLIDSALTVADLQRILKISRGMSYELVNSGLFPIIRIGRAIRIPRKTFQEWYYKNATVMS